MAICSYVIIPERGAAEALGELLGALPGCDVARALNRDVLVLVTDTATAAEETALRETIERMDGIRALVLAFGEIDGDAPVADRAARGRDRRRALPVAEPDAVRSMLDAAFVPTARDP